MAEATFIVVVATLLIYLLQWHTMRGQLNAMREQLNTMRVFYEEGRKFEQTQMQADRNTAVERKLGEWTDVLCFYGIDLTDDADRVSAKQVAYLVMSVNAMTVDCSVRGVSVLDEMTRSSYRKLMFSMQHTRCVWKYARRCITSHWREPIDRYLADTYGEKYEDLSLVEKPH